MKSTRLIMGMPITVEVLNAESFAILNKVFAYFTYIDNKFSTYKEDSEISRLNRGEISPDGATSDMRTILRLSEHTKKETGGYFDISFRGKLDPAGLVKGWAILQAAMILDEAGVENYYIEAGGDIQVKGKNAAGENWRIGIRNPFKLRQIVKVLSVSDLGIATSGTYERGRHIYNPKTSRMAEDDIVSLSVVGPNIYEADRFATAAFAMGRQGIYFLEKQPNLEGYMIDKKGIATMTSGFGRYVK